MAFFLARISDEKVFWVSSKKAWTKFGFWFWGTFPFLLFFCWIPNVFESDTYAFVNFFRFNYVFWFWVLASIGTLSTLKRSLVHFTPEKLCCCAALFCGFSLIDCWKNSFQKVFDQTLQTSPEMHKVFRPHSLDHDCLCVATGPSSKSA